MAAAVNPKTSEYSFPYQTSREVGKPSFQTNPQANASAFQSAKTYSEQGLQKPLLTNPAGEQAKQQSSLSSPGQFSLKSLNMDQIFKKDPAFDVEKYREIFHIPNKRFLEIPGEKRSKLKDTKLLKDLIGNEEMSGILSPSPEKVKEDLTEISDSKQDLLLLKNEVNTLKKKVDQIEIESQRSSFKNPTEVPGNPVLDKPQENSRFGRNNPVSLNRDNKLPTVSVAMKPQAEYTPYKQNTRAENPGFSTANSQNNKNPLTPNAQKLQQYNVSASPSYNPSIYKSPTYTPMSVKSPANNLASFIPQRSVSSETPQAGPTRGLPSPTYNPTNSAKPQSNTQQDYYKPQYDKAQTINPKAGPNTSSSPKYVPSSYLKKEETKSNPPVTQQEHPNYQPSYQSPGKPEPLQTTQNSYKPQYVQNATTPTSTPTQGYQPISSKYLQNAPSPNLENRSKYSNPADRKKESNPVLPGSVAQSSPGTKYSTQTKAKPLAPRRLESEKKAEIPTYLPVSSGQRVLNIPPQHQPPHHKIPEISTKLPISRNLETLQSETPPSSFSKREGAGDDEPSSYYPGMFSSRRGDPAPSTTLPKVVNTLPNSTLDDGANTTSYVANVMNFYEYHLETLKNMVVKQNETISNQKGQIESYEQDLSLYKHKVTDLEDKLREQVSLNQQMFAGLQNKYGTAMNEIGRFKDNIQTLAGRISDQQLNPMQPLQNNNLFKELDSMRGGLNDHKTFIHELDQAKSSLQRQIQDLEKMYQDELQKSTEITKQNQIQNALAGHRVQYDKIDQMNQAILRSCEQTLQDLDIIRESTRQSAYLNANNKILEFDSNYNWFLPSHIANQPEPVHREERRSSKVKDNDINNKNSVVIYDNHEDPHREYQKIKNKNERSLVQNLMNWAPSGKTNAPKRDYQDNAATIKPNYQRKVPSNRYQVAETEIEDLKRIKRDIEDELLKLPQNLRTANQRRNKAQLERDLEETEFQIEAHRSELRKSAAH